MDRNLAFKLMNTKLAPMKVGWIIAAAVLLNVAAGAGTTNVVFRRGFNPGPVALEANGFLWVGPFENRSDQFLNSPRANLATVAQRWPTTNAAGNAVIRLTANQKYYFELLFKEGS